jgi:Flp pilus assembly protein TadD
MMLILSNMPAADSSRSGYSCSGSALPLYQHQQYDVAERRLEECLRVDPQDASAHELLGLVFDAAGMQQQAGDQLREALRLAAENSHYRFNLATFLAKTDQIEEADQAVRPLLGSESGPDFYRLVGYIRLRQRQEREAASWFQRAVDAAPGSTDAWYRLGFSHHSLGEFPQAILCYREVLRLDPRHFFARLQLGKILLLQGDYAGAREQLMEATRIQPAYASTWRYLSETQMFTGEMQTALGSARVAVERDSSDPRNHHQLGLILKRLGNDRGAATEFQTMEELRARPHSEATLSAPDSAEY